ncbi:DUF1330 domain-containing protein [Streptosporangium sp. NBC_01756]|uniref:DUF1330 domain-containing protein n=1 Tax=Streptosporangium sp. NBC_01756 TaxID=2975950 RepID=UPI002DD8C9D5|nr:DUF1330 domain-containing protein [Streptosporangium sp. NBC_01756]WSC88390.1 DUF1330 domain-containing protein [Streptosporangium sp. NBC_01756]
MTAYVIADVRLTGDADELAEYRSKVIATLEPYGGKYLARGGPVTVVEGDWEPGQLVVVEFPTVEAAHAWNESAAYQEIAPLRSRNTDSRRLIVEGL